MVCFNIPSALWFYWNNTPTWRYFLDLISSDVIWCGSNLTKTTGCRTVLRVCFPLDSWSYVMLVSCTCIGVFPAPASPKKHHMTQVSQKWPTCNAVWKPLFSVSPDVDASFCWCAQNIDLSFYNIICNVILTLSRLTVMKYTGQFKCSLYRTK